MSLRKCGAVIAVVCAAALIVPVTAGAQTLPSGTQTASLARVPVSGVAKNHKRFKGHFAVDRFVSRSGKTFAVGTLTGKLGHRRINRSNVAIPASVPTGSAVGAAHTAQRDGHDPADVEFDRPSSLPCPDTAVMSRTIGWIAQPRQQPAEHAGPKHPAALQRGAGGPNHWQSVRSRRNPPTHTCPRRP